MRGERRGQVDRRERARRFSGKWKFFGSTLNGRMGVVVEFRIIFPYPAIERSSLIGYFQYLEL
jgi:hypothetical protein